MKFLWIVLAILFLAFGFAQAQTFNACYSNKDGNLRLVQGPQNCKPGETFTSWVSASPNPTPYVYMISQDFPLPPELYREAILNCDPGDKALSGFYDVNSNWSPYWIKVLVSRPTDDGNGWHFRYEYPTYDMNVDPNHLYTVGILCGHGF